MTVETTDYTPKGKKLSNCTHEELLHTVRAINSHGMLRMHAQERMLNYVQQEAAQRGYGLYEYNDRTPWETKAGVRYSIAKGGQELKESDHHECIACQDNDREIFQVFNVAGPLTKEWKEKILKKMKELADKDDVYQAKWRAKEEKAGRGKSPGFITGCMIQ